VPDNPANERAAVPFEAYAKTIAKMGQNIEAVATARPEEIQRCPICNWPMASSVKEGCVPGNCSQRPAAPLRIATPGTDEIARLRRKVETLTAALAEAQAEHCPGCDCCYDLSRPIVAELGKAFGLRYHAPIAEPICSRCQGRKGLPHWPRCQRQGIVTEANCQEGPNA
jgi:hypothetical protein